MLVPEDVALGSDMKKTFTLFLLAKNSRATPKIVHSVLAYLSIDSVVHASEGKI